MKQSLKKLFASTQMARMTRVAGLFLLMLPLLMARASAQGPAGYYDTVDLTNSSTAHGSLHEIIDDHTRYPYTSTSTDTWDILNLADEDPSNINNIIDVYKNASYTKISGGVGDYNREHVWPKSYGFPTDNADNYPYTDCHHLMLADGGYNSSRSNKPFRFCSAGCSENPTEFNNGRGGGTGVYPGNSNWTTGSFTQGTWETWGGRRGDVARAIFYMAVRYDGGTHSGTGSPEPDLIVTDNETLIDSGNTGSNESVAYMGMLADLLNWHYADPVDDDELWHNEVVASFQGNRNPFVDHPEWVACVLQNLCTPDSTPPAAPIGLTAIAGNSAVTLDWTANTEPDLAGYNLFRSTTAGGPYTQVNGPVISGTTTTDTGLTNGTTYFYVLQAVDTWSNASGDSNEASATPQGGGGGPGQVLLSEVFYNPSGTDDGLEWVELYNSGATAVDLSTHSLGNGGTSYTYSTVQLSGTIAPGATFVVGGPTSNGTNANPSFDLAVNFSPDFQNSGTTADGVALFDVSTAQISSSVPIDAVVYGSSNTNGLIDETGAANSPEVGNAPTGSSIERVDLAGAWQIQASPTPNTPAPGLAVPDTTPPADPTGLLATAGDSQVDLGWDANGEGDLAGYNVHRATSPGGPYSQLNGSLVATASYSDTTVTNGTTYYYVVTAVDTSANESGTSNEASATPTAVPDTTPPADPTGLTATAGDGVVDLGWDANGEGDLAGYNVHRATVAGGPFTQLNGSLVATASYSDTTVTNGTTYHYVVTTVDTSANESGSSNEASATPAPPPAQTSNLATADWSTFRGTISGSYADTHIQDDVYEELIEGLSGGKPASRYSTIEHVWTFDVAAGVSYTFAVDAHHGTSSEGDDFLFYYSRDDVNYSLMLTVTKTADDDTLQSFVFPEDVAGTLYVLATDTDRTAGNQILDSLFVDEMVVITDGGGGPDTTPPAAPSALGTTAGDGTVGLDWADNGESDLAGYNVYRSITTGGPYSQINGALVPPSDYVDSTVANGTTYYYVVTAVDTSSNESGDSNEASATPQGGGGATTMHVDSIVLSTVGGGKKKGRAEVTLVDDLGDPVSGVIVSGTFTGTYNESGSASADAAGLAKIDTIAREKDPISFTFCVDNVTDGSLTYDPGSNVETCVVF